MPQHDLPLILITRHLDADLHVGEALFFPEVVSLHAKPDRLHTQLRALARELLASASPADVHRRLAGITPEVSRLHLTLTPPTRSVAWSQPITLAFHLLRWRHGDEATLAYVPALGIEVVAPRDDQLDDLLEKNIRVTLARTKLAEKLFDLAQLDRITAVSLDRQTLTAEIQTPAQANTDRDDAREKAKPVIATAGQVLTDADPPPPAYEIDPLVRQLADALVGRHPKSILLVGPAGVGKTAAFHELFRQRDRHHLQVTPFWMTSGARLIAGQSGYGVWQERCQTLCREARKAGALLHLGNLVELMEVGKAGGSQFGIASFFRPYLSRGDVLAVAECTPEQLPLIERVNPHLLAAFHTIKVDQPPAPTVRTILHRAATDIGADLITDAALDTLERLHRRYATYSAAPGRPLRFLKNLLHDQTRNSALGTRNPLSPSDVTTAFSRETGLPLFLLDDATPLDLDAAHTHFTSRVIGQGEAVDLVTDLLATVKAALNRPRRPIASLLFIGPTGVGKTEMAKALADYFFGSTQNTKMEDRGWKIEKGADASSPSSILHPPSSSSPALVRFDMSEFNTPAAVARLVGTAWESEGLLSRKVREQPFCVILLDEFEKAYPAFFDLLLQVLGEGRLTDPSGRLADFSNAIVCMTSNLGAESFTAGPFGLSRATTAPDSHAKAHFTDALRDFLRPELFNRIDRVVPFLPLDRPTVERIAAREIELITRRDGVLRRDVRLDVTPAALAHLATAGYDPLYGARPLKRRIEQDLLAPLADAINQYAPTTPIEARVDLNADQLTIDVHALSRPSRGTVPGATVTAPAELARRAAAARRRTQAIVRCPAHLAVQNELFTLNRLVARKDAHPGRRFVDPAQRERIKRLQSTADALTALSKDAIQLEDALLLHLYEATPVPPGVDARLTTLESAASRVLLELFSMPYPQPHAITLALFGPGPNALCTLARTYHEAVTDDDTRAPQSTPPVTPAVSFSYYTRLGKSTLQRTFVDPKDVPTFLTSPRTGVLGIALAITAPFARARFETERGLHVIQEERDLNPQPIWLDASPVPSPDYAPPKDVEFRVALAGQRRRTYTLDRKEADDTTVGQTYHWSGKAICEAVTAAVDENLRRRLARLVAPTRDV